MEDALEIVRDITERKRTEEALRESEEKFRLLFNRVFDAIVMIDENGKIVDVNEATCRLLGYSKEELQKLCVEDIHPKEEMEKIQSAISRVLRNGIDYMGETAFVNKDGKIVRVEAGGVTFKVGDKTYIIGSFRDVTERKKAEEALRRSEEQAKRLLEFQSKVIDTAVVWIDLLDAEGNVTLWNRAAELISGYSREEVIGHKKIWEWLYPDPEYRAKIFATAKKIIESGERLENFETTIRCKDGALKTISWYSNNLLDEKGNPAGSIAVGSDITERKRLEEKLREYSEHLEELVQKRTEELLESEKRYSVLVEEASDGVLILQDEKIVFSNKKGPEMVGYSRDEIIGLPFENLVDEKYRQHAKERYMRRLQGETVPATIEIEVIAKTGERVPVEIGGTLIHYQGHPADLIIVRDISERKRMEEQRLKLGKLATIGELAAMVGHDLRNPLQAITNASYVINEICKGMDFAGEKFSCVPPHLRKEMFEGRTQLTKMMGIINKSIEYANKIVSDLRDFARTKEPELTEVDLGSLIQETLSHISIPENVRVSIRHDQALSKLCVDPTQMRRVFTNLTTNAIQAMPKGGELTISTSLKDGLASIAFQDTGVGIPKEDIEKLFTPLFTTKSKGVGLGLTICKNIVEAHGGGIEVESQEGKGSTFTVKLPVKKGGETGGEEGKHPDRG